MWTVINQSSLDTLFYIFFDVIFRNIKYYIDKIVMYVFFDVSRRWLTSVFLSLTILHLLIFEAYKFHTLYVFHIGMCSLLAVHQKVPKYDVYFLLTLSSNLCYVVMCNIESICSVIILYAVHPLLNITYFMLDCVALDLLSSRSLILNLVKPSHMSKWPFWKLFFDLMFFPSFNGFTRFICFSLWFNWP